MSKKDRQLKKAAKARDENGIIRNDIFLNFKIDQKFHLNDHHKAFVDVAMDEGSQILFCDGPAGSSKTYLAVYVALTMLRDKKIDEIVYIRSIVESATRKLGSLPGEVDEKFKPWSIPLIEKCDELVGKQITEMLFNSDYLKSIPVNFLRGSTFTNNVVIVDEAQNLEHSELVTILTRFGKNCKLFVIGDSRQSDIQKSGFERIMNAFDTPASKEHGIHPFHFTEEDITRSKLLKFIVSVVQTIKIIKDPKTSRQTD
jgi:phosphate starvation-inducible PhoH-like protein